MTAEKMDIVQERLNHTTGRIVTPLTKTLLDTLARETSVTWRTGRLPNKWKPACKSYLAFDMGEPFLSHHPLMALSVADRLVAPSQFVQSVAIFCPKGCTLTDDNA